MDDASSRLDILKALGDNTRYAIYLEVARSARPLSTSEIATTLGLHVNTVRPHLERMREVGLLEVSSESRGGVGRPQHVYGIASGAPSLGLEPPAFPLLAQMLVDVCRSAGLGAGDVVDVGREQGTAAARTTGTRRGLVASLCDAQAALGFDPEVVDDDGAQVIAFTHCPYRELAEAQPEVVCGLHRGMVEGFVEGHPSNDCRVRAFRILSDRSPCQAELVGAI